MPPTWLHLISYFFGGLFFSNAVPHVVRGMMGQALPNSLCKTPGDWAFLIDRECVVGLLQHRHGISACASRR
jgi:hypothetical protein